MTWIGIDFSGSAAQWNPGRTKSNVWIATLTGSSTAPVLTAVHTIRLLAGTGAPFSRLTALLKAGGFEAAGIDAPFSIPAPWIGGTHEALLAQVAAIPRDGRPFPGAVSFVTTVAGTLPLSPKKPLRATESFWASHGLNVRSTLWAGPRGGAAMTAACLTLLAAAERPIWPLASGTGMLVEAFPMAQLRQWRIPYTGYSDAGSPNHLAIVSALGKRVTLGPHVATLQGSPDATDSVLAAFAGMAAATGRLAAAPGPMSSTEGWIAVHV